jgi:hypothetical protein
MEKSEAVKLQPELQITTSGDFWGLGQNGTFDVVGLYKGKYSREASDSSWFDTVSIKDGEMVAEITRLDSNESWQLVCSGGGVKVTYMNVDFGGNSPYRCSITQDNTKVGEFQMASQGSMINLSIAKKEVGTVRLGSIHYNIESIHTSDDLMMAVERPLGYSFKQGTEEVAAAQTNGILTLQMLDDLPENQKNIIVVGTIASALSWRPED